MNIDLYYQLRVGPCTQLSIQICEQFTSRFEKQIYWQFMRVAVFYGQLQKDLK